MANGDITPTTPRQDTGMVFQSIMIDVRNAIATVQFVDGLGVGHVAVVQNGTSTGFVYATGAPTSVATPTGFNDLMAQLTLTNAKKTAAIQSLVTAGIIAVTGAVA
ncbi:MAG TPA: hypothetical protein VFJ24_07135 [Gaiellales bacterium]|nr:hypothetical protein [Gaiellales bacterium]